MLNSEDQLGSSANSVSGTLPFDRVVSDLQRILKVRRSDAFQTFHMMSAALGYGAAVRRVNQLIQWTDFDRIG
jgi:hypothetical protein